MTRTTPSDASAHTPLEPRGWAVGGTLFAGVMLLVEGVLGALEGIAALAKDDVYARVGDYVYKFNLTAWGWIHLVLGVLLAVVGWGLLSGPRPWARVPALMLASLSLVAHFLYLPYQPWWALIGIALSVFVIAALASDWRPETR
ncbi:DUF7144 family membrane protein [Streptomyces hundungensis]|uniref:DUF7144 family membrane protein n=1 Tax=Streptomyces hundungensis TaxID=1077946 RepID=UPI0033FF6A23